MQLQDCWHSTKLQLHLLLHLLLLLLHLLLLLLQSIEQLLGAGSAAIAATGSPASN
jgi:hypothetical protein